MIILICIACSFSGFCIGRLIENRHYRNELLNLKENDKRISQEWRDFQNELRLAFQSKFRNGGRLIWQQM